MLENAEERARRGLRRAREYVRGHRVAVLALVFITLQNSALTLLLRYSRGVLHERYSTSSNVLLIELTKAAVCAAVMWTDAPAGARSVRLYVRSMRASVLAFVPAFIYFCQNVLQFFALQNLEAGVFAVLAQLKTLTTAVFAVTMLHKRLSANQWRALCLVVLAAILVESPPKVCPAEAEALAEPAAAAAATAAAAPHNSSLGVALVLIICVLSGFSGVYFERVLKTTQLSLWERNFQLAVWSMGFALLSIAIFDGRRVLAEGLFAGFSVWSFLIVLVQAAGGLLTAVVMKHTDNIVKGFAMAIAICLTSLLSIPLFGAQLTREFWVGAFMVILSIFNYSDVRPGAAPASPTSVRVPPPPPSSSSSSSSGAAADVRVVRGVDAEPRDTLLPVTIADARPDDVSEVVPKQQ